MSVDVGPITEHAAARRDGCPTCGACASHAYCTAPTCPTCGACAQCIAECEAGEIYRDDFVYSDSNPNSTDPAMVVDVMTGDRIEVINSADRHQRSFVMVVDEVVRDLQCITFAGECEAETGHVWRDWANTITHVIVKLL